MPASSCSDVPLRVTWERGQLAQCWLHPDQHQSGSLPPGASYLKGLGEVYLDPSEEALIHLGAHSFGPIASPIPRPVGSRGRGAQDIRGA